MNTLYLKQSRLQGVAGGRQLSCFFRVAPGGLRIPAGEYMLLPAVNNPLHGPVLSLVPAGVAGKMPGYKDTAAATTMDQAASGMKDTAGIKMRPPVAAAGCWKFTPNTITSAGAGGNPAMEMEFKMPAGAGNVALVVAGKPMGGTNALIVDQGFSELVDAVAKNGGIKVIVS